MEDLLKGEEAMGGAGTAATSILFATFVAEPGRKYTQEEMG